MITVFNPPVTDIELFCQDCEVLGYNNNSSLKAMKYEWCLEQGGGWWGTYHQDKIVSIAGCHPFWDGYRFLFRGAQTMSAQAGLSKTHMTSIPWSIIMPEQISWTSGVITEENPAYITTNVEHDESGKMNRTHRVLKILSNQSVVDYVTDDDIYYIRQSVWRLNIGRYFETLG